MKVLVVFLLVVLGCSLAEGRLVSKCELRDELMKAIDDLTKNGTTLSGENFVAKVVCHAELASGFNTSAVKELKTQSPEVDATGLRRYEGLLRAIVPRAPKRRRIKKRSINLPEPLTIMPNNPTTVPKMRPMPFTLPTRRAMLFTLPPVRPTLPPVRPTLPPVRPTLPPVRPTLPPVRPTQPHYRPMLPRYWPTLPPMLPPTLSPTQDTLPPMLPPSLPPICGTLPPVLPPIWDTLPPMPPPIRDTLPPMLPPVWDKLPPMPPPIQDTLPPMLPPIWDTLPPMPPPFWDTPPPMLPPVWDTLPTIQPILRTCHHTRILRSPNHEEDWMFYGLFQLSGNLVCNGTADSANICGIDCSNLTDDDIGDDINCLLKILTSPVGSNSGAAHWEKLKTMIELIFQDECRDKKSSKYFSDCL